MEDENGNRQRRRLNNQERNRLMFHPSEGARLTYSEMARYPAMDPPAEEYNPEIHRGISNPSSSSVTVLPESESVPPICLMRAIGATHAYAFLSGKEPISLNHHAPGWGELHFGVIYNRVVGIKGEGNVFQAPASPEVARYVAIKKLNKRVVARYLRRGGAEDPYKEIHRMQELGDNVHVLQCTEALEDDDFLYIVTPKACSEGTLVDLIEWESPDTLPLSRVRKIFRKILDILQYLELHSISHRDLSPDNLLFLTPDNLVAFDLALSVRIPRNEETGHRSLITPQGSFGTRTWMAPEIFMDRIHCGVYADLWSAANLLYNLLTNNYLYELPLPTDISFRYFILARGLSLVPMNERLAEMHREVFGPDGRMEDRSTLEVRAQAQLDMSPEAIELLENLLRMSIADRWTLAQAMTSTFMQQED